MTECWTVCYNNNFTMRRQQRYQQRYEAVKGGQFLDYISKQIKGRSSKNTNSRNYSSNKPSNQHNASDMFSQPQLIKPKRGNSVFRNSSSSKYAESMGKFRKDFIKDSYVNYDVNDSGRRKVTTKEENSISIANGLNFEEEVGVEEMHYQMVRLQQNVKKMHKDT